MWSRCASEGYIANPSLVLRPNVLDRALHDAFAVGTRFLRSFIGARNSSVLKRRLPFTRRLEVGDNRQRKECSGRKDSKLKAG
jgi:hypothetical protein